MRSFLLALIIFSPLSSGEDASLGPASSPYDFFLSDYRIAVIQTLSEPMGGAPGLQMLVLPSFQPEYVIGVIGGDEPFARIVTLDAQIWSRMHDDPFVRPRPTVSTFKLSQELYDGIESYACNALKDVRYHEDKSIGLDGVTFNFSAWCPMLGSPLGAKAWSPHSDTKAGRLVAVFHSLKEAADKSGKEQNEVLEELLTTIKKRSGTSSP